MFNTASESWGFKSEMMFKLDSRGIFGFHYKRPEEILHAKTGLVAESVYLTSARTGLALKIKKTLVCVGRDLGKSIYLCAESFADSCH